MRHALLLAAVLAVRASAAAAEAEGPAAALPGGPPTNLWFAVGESLRYRIYWGYMPVGITLVTTEWIEEDGRRLIAIRYQTRSNKVLDKLYPVDDLIEAVIEPERFLPVRFTKRLSEGKYESHEEVVFHHDRLEAEWRNVRKGKTKTLPIEADTRDLVTAMFHMRQMELRPGDVRTVKVMADDKLFDLTLRADEVEPVNLERYGRVPSLKVVPEAAFQGLFVHKGKVTVWISDDSRRLVTAMSGSVPIASIRVVLDRIGAPAAPPEGEPAPEQDAAPAPAADGPGQAG